MILTNQVQIKGTANGLLIQFGAGLWEQVIGELDSRLTERAGFYQGARASLQLGERLITRGQIEEIGALLDQHGVTLVGLSAETAEMLELARRLGLETPTVRRETLRPAEEQAAPLASEAANSAMERPLLVHRTLRSGQTLNHNGAIVVIGDVNPGAEVISAGDVIVWGKLRGTVHAGAPDNPSAIVCALTLAPTQLRIGGILGYDPGKGSPRGRARRSVVPEIASLQGDHIVVVPWQD